MTHAGDDLHTAMASRQEGVLNPAAMLAILQHLRSGVVCGQISVRDDQPVDWICLQTNPAFHALTGLVDVLGRSASEFFPITQPSAAGLLAACARVAAGGAPESLEIAGAPLCLALQARVIGVAAGQFAVMLDPLVTDPQTTGLELENFQRFQVALANSPVLVFEQDLQLRYTWIYNPKLGYAAHQVIGKTDADIMDPGYAAELEDIKRQVMASGEPERQEVATAAPGAAPEFYDLYVEPRRNAAGTIIGIIGAATEISEHKRVAQELRSYRIHLEELIEARTRDFARATEKARLNEERYRFALGATHDGVWDLNVQTNLAYVNSAYREMLGDGEGDLTNVPTSYWLDRLHPDEKEHVVASVYRELEEVGSYEIEFRMRCNDGSYKWILSRGQVADRDADGNPRRVVGTHVDLTTRKLMESQLREAKEFAESASRAKSTFLANMSHELRTPMTGIMGMTALALRQTTEPRLVDKLKKIEHASNHLLHVINDILDISKIEAERLTLERVTFRLGQSLENLRSMIGHKAMEKGLSLIIDVPPAMQAMSVSGDPTRLDQILLNLVGNAVKFTAQGTIVVRMRELAGGADEVVLHCEVQDSGIGVAAQDQPRLFSVFEQADSSTTRKFGGTGLGLAISKRLVKLMGGDIGLESVPGSGSTFWFTVRFGKAVAAEGRVASSGVTTAEELLKARFAGTRVLVVEDDAINQEIARMLLEDVGLVVESADDGKLALEMALFSQYDLILMDMQMPNLGGVAATRSIRTFPGYANIPILAMTANAFSEDRQACLDAGMNDHIPKPVSPDQLYAILLKWLSAQVSDPVPDQASGQLPGVAP